MTENPIKIEKNVLATKALAIMNEKKLLACVFMKRKKNLSLLEFYIFIIF